MSTTGKELLFMKSILLRRVAPLCLLLCAVLLVGCSSPHKIVPEDPNVYLDTKTGSTYTVLPASYEPISRGALYGELELSGLTYELYEITGLDSSLWLCSVWGDVYCGEHITVPSFEQWDLTALHVCTTTAVSVSELTIRENALYSEQMCQTAFSALQSAYTDGSALVYPSYAKPDRVYTLRFEAQNVAGLYYAIQLIEYGEDIYQDLPDETGALVQTNVGRTVLYDRYAGRCVAVDDFLFRMLDGESAEDVLS